MGKFKMPSMEQLLKRKRIYDRKRDPVWVFLEREMRQMDEQGIKPYNNTVGKWLKFLRDLKYFFYTESKRKLKQLWRDVGPPWYFEYSPLQLKVIERFPTLLRESILDNTTKNVKIALREIGITLRFPSGMVLSAMQSSLCDSGLFFWDLFKAYYEQPPCEVMPKYDLNAKLLMSAIVFCDIDECIQTLEKLCRCTRTPSPPRQRETKKNCGLPECKYGPYLQKLCVPKYTSEHIRDKPPCPLPMKLKSQTEEYYIARLVDDSIIAVTNRKNRQIQHVLSSKRVCNYKFWVAPIIIDKGTRNPKAQLLAIKMKMYKTTAPAKHVKLLPNLTNEVIQIGNVSFSGGTAVYIIQSIGYTPPGYVIHNAGKVQIGSDNITIIAGHYKFPKDIIQECDTNCDCIEKWNESTMKYLKDNICNCGHRYDFHNKGKRLETYFYPATRHVPYFFNYAKIYQFFFPGKPLTAAQGNLEDFICERVAYEFDRECRSQSKSSLKSIAQMKCWEYVRAFLAELSKSPLLIPHLPEAYHLNRLVAWACKRVHGKVSPKRHKRLLCIADRRWTELGHVDFRTRAYRIPFSRRELKHCNFCHRVLIGKLSHKLFIDFKTRTGLKQVERTQLWLGTMKHDIYPNKKFTEVFFSYFPCRITDVAVLNPYKKAAFAIFGHTCPLNYGK